MKMIIPNEVKKFLSTTQDISLGYHELNFFKARKIIEEQVGYRYDPNGNSLITGESGDWQEEWLVIATDDLGDPIFVDISLPQLPVLRAIHGEGYWEPFIIADSLDNLKSIISVLHKIARNRTSPVDLEANPINGDEADSILTNIQKQNPNSEISFWKGILE